MRLHPYQQKQAEERQQTALRGQIFTSGACFFLYLDVTHFVWINAVQYTGVSRNCLTQRSAHCAPVKGPPEPVWRNYLLSGPAPG
ncbi:hypothetical protein IRJ41_010634 [Triplophysa rosa]|uniref:Uncharacterized protein n=1 Tax=Triplophysa rosa TaxID=992332 RepID=A0A9W7TPD7_TRIRA|nr:hypothetical protein IRJ41_010634 [Triplophysa rosa]